MAGSDHHHGTVLGKSTDYISVYSPSLLCPIPRQQSRRELGIQPGSLPFRGVDIWTAYEVSWLNNDGKPEVAIAEFEIPANSPAIIESKSFKLYLNSFNQTAFTDAYHVTQTLESDLSAAAGAAVMVRLLSLQQFARQGVGHFAGECIDQEPVKIDCYSPSPDLLGLSNPDKIVSETLYSDLLKSNCPVTGQPDWASVFVQYRGAQIDRAGLLKYIISFREHQDFHEHCVERMFLEIQQRCNPDALTVYARYTRRGGLDINPYRTNGAEVPADVRLVRQ
ncbi:NADPH-dependent 7-cyano-7-deazaguanine reductase QueF [Aestuariicella hydrocarbonica]|uniref:NADPH-dependent 7-cyano-7-deazaguanine reductase n=1 Tax=Pseudomaricurvus hydrocarbonicus TaxID=1470433 RepID=A0A9E5JTV9_9GAMM|nr:NADPH-dependent 7-cyano-7-deazaguanine reductase QueF [Aestuariicella hydrocarbonica]NHO64780.1 NADPH-dependent 7-cyano-7-deazaguanine reductase QueF [Aestuariicella hydrocarbonica]